jgi:hypothetical protein
VFPILAVKSGKSALKVKAQGSIQPTPLLLFVAIFGIGDGSIKLSHCGEHTILK